MRLTLDRVPPSPDVMAGLYLRYLRDAKKFGITFRQFLEIIGYGNPADDVDGMDDAGVLFRERAGAIQRIEVPQTPVTGSLPVKVLLVDFVDKPGHLPPSHFEDMLFSVGAHPIGSMADFYKEVSLGKVEIAGSAHGWLRLPEPYAYYTNNESGMKPSHYPRNAQRMAEDAVRAALANGVVFDADLDKLGQGIVTALFIVHAGRGAEALHPSIAGSEIWSHKWALRTPIQVSPNLQASIYLTVPEDCMVGVCAHELGHLAFQWQDFYDPNYAEDGEEWAGSGAWDLMAGGSWNGGGSRPAHPAGLHKSQHGWVDVETMKKKTGTASVTLPPFTSTYGKVLRLESHRLKPKQYFILENRCRTGFDAGLPGEGLLVWRVDERGEQEAPDVPGMLLIQADGLHELESNWDQGDAGDPFPGSTGRTNLGDKGPISTSYPKQARSGIRLANIKTKGDGTITLDVRFG